MRRFISDLKQRWKDRPFVWSDSGDGPPNQVRLPASGKVLVLGPHPDDPESVAITCRLLRESGCDIWYSIVSFSPSGVENEYARRGEDSGQASLHEIKIEIRRKEQTRAAEMFALPCERLSFLAMEDNKGIGSRDDPAGIRDHLESMAPDIVIMPVGKDANRTHEWVCQAFRECAKELTRKTGKPVVALYNEDPKTIAIREDLFVLFGAGGAQWKRELLRAHDSQQQRNINSRGVGFDERILNLNHLGYRRLHEKFPGAALSGEYAEVFEIELFDSSLPEAND